MADHLRAAVSRNKRRYKCDGYNLDLSYIEPTIIAMGYPAENIESIYRNQLDQVVKFLNEKHPNHYKIYNLCKERRKNNYPKSKFTGIVSEDFSFKDHAPPPLENIKPFCEDVQSWLLKSSENVVVVHCKAGKGRTGVMICCYLLHCGRFNTAEDVLQHYAKNRTVDEKGVTIPSQRRYVEYYAKLRRSSLQYKHTKLRIRAVFMENIPNTGAVGLSIEFNIYWGNRKKSVNMKDPRSRESKYYFSLNDPLEVSGDVRVEFAINKTLLPVVKEKLFAICFNTFFVEETITYREVSERLLKTSSQDLQDSPEGTRQISSHSDSVMDTCMTPPSSQTNYSPKESPQSEETTWKVLRLNKCQLDKACKTKEFPDSACVQLLFNECSETISGGSGEAPGHDEHYSDTGDDQVEEETSEEEDTSYVRITC